MSSHGWAAGPLGDELDSRMWTIVTVTYNSARHLRSCWRPGTPDNARWLIVDNDSTDNTVAVATELGAEVIRLPRNTGFSAANNVGLAQVQSDWVAFVNPDVTVRSGEDLNRLARIAEANAGFVAPQLLNPDGTEQPNARGLPFPLTKLANRSLRLPGIDVNAYARTGLRWPVHVAWVMGAVLAGRTEDFRTIGGWDERFFLYYEDHDIGLRAWAANKPVVVDPSVQWTHQWQRETTHLRLRPWLHELRSAALFYLRYPTLITHRRARQSELFQYIQAQLWQKASTE